MFTTIKFAQHSAVPKTNVIVKSLLIVQPRAVPSSLHALPSSPSAHLCLRSNPQNQSLSQTPGTQRRTIYHKDNPGLAIETRLSDKLHRQQIDQADDVSWASLTPALEDIHAHQFRKLRWVSRQHLILSQDFWTPEMSART